MQFHNFIDKLINDKGINDLDKEELKNEFYDHLTMLKNEYIKKGKSEDEAIKLSIQKFGESNFLGNEIKNNLPSRNKFKTLPTIETIKCLMLMFFFFLSITLISSYNNLSNNKIPLILNFLLALIILLIALNFITIKLYDLSNFNKTLIKISILYFIFEKISIFILNIVLLFFSGNIIKGIFHTQIFLYKYAFSFNYVMSYIIVFIAFLFLGKYFFVKFSVKLFNKFNSKIMYIVLFGVSILFLIIYFMIITSPYFFYRIFNLLSINSSNIQFNKGNIFYISFNNIIFPNVGLILMLISLMILIFDLKSKKVKKH